MKNKKTILLLVLFVLVLLLILFILKQPHIKNDMSDNTNKKQLNGENIKNEIDSSLGDKTDLLNSNDSGPSKIEKEENENEREENITVDLVLIGEEEITIKQGEKYIDEGVIATDSSGNDVTDKISIDNKVNTNKKGEYMVIYSYGKSIVIRKVIVE